MVAAIMLTLLLGAGVVCLLIASGILKNTMSSNLTEAPRYQKIRLYDGGLLEGPENVLGKGAFGLVCEYKLDGQAVAVKMPTSRVYNTFQQHELKLLEKANPHVNIITYIKSIEFDRKIWIIMELMTGSVRDLLNNNLLLSWITKLSLATQMAAGIFHLHNISSGYVSKKAIVHQDLKTDNLLVDRLSDDPNIKLKITDFGISREVDQVSLPILGTIHSKSHEGCIGGTLIYTAPEMINAMAQNKDCCEPKSDVFSAGIVLWEIATNKLPLRNEYERQTGAFKLFDRDKNDGRQRITKSSFFSAANKTETKPTYPQSSFFGPIIDKCIQLKVNDRPSSRKLLENLKQISIG